MTTLAKADFYANEKRRRTVVAIGLQAAGANPMRFISPSWGDQGENTLKITRINWDMRQAAGGKICLELTTELADFCMDGDSTCW